MSAFGRLSAVLALVAIILSSRPAIAQNADSGEQAKIVEAVKTIFVAAKADDLALFHSVIAPGFYMYDGGARFEGDGIMTLIKSAHAAGQVYEWNVTDPDVHITGNAAWIAYVNKGSITDTSVMHNQEWLESAFLEKQQGSWKIVFFHSTRIAVKQER